MSKEMRKLINQFRLIANAVPNKVRTNGNLNEVTLPQGDDSDIKKLISRAENTINKVRTRYKNDSTLDDFDREYGYISDPIVQDIYWELMDTMYRYNSETRKVELDKRKIEMIKDKDAIEKRKNDNGFNQWNLNEGHGDWRVAFHYKSIINGLRQRYENEGDYEWHTDPDILNAEEALREVGFFYDDESWDVFPNEG